MMETLDYEYHGKINHVPKKLIWLVAWRIRQKQNDITDYILAVAQGKI